MIFIRKIEENDISSIVTAYNEPIGCDGNFENYIKRCYKENVEGKRITFIALINNEIAGYVNLLFSSLYPYFLEKNIPEINDLIVISKYRRKGIGKKLIDECEKYAANQYEFIGLGVGLYKDYGSAQRLYTENGYMLDGNGLMYNNVEVKPGRDVFVDDDLLLYLYKKL
ncbi:GNAT family N-acetyltransferase [Sedimentibacter sp. zth1]|uniref:GNAT family N-acetyltransferase n=1 Tax=Sedimentibacter sp. zth1 TaxID=2816908 RepID=UPI001A9189CA|nr:GNAT family N-acetyltransferase [Sedimentibacter sp. zth1]QSX04657.1 GNAT family N-acetyltransferase [Sedimentibacter sp. zth1]